MKKLLIVSIFILFIFTVGYFFFHRQVNSYKNHTHNIGFTNIQGWKISSTSDVNTTFTSKLTNGLNTNIWLNIIPYPNQTGFSDKYRAQDHLQQYEELCKNSAQEEGLTYKNIEPVILNKTNFYKCNMEKLNATNKLITFNEYIADTKDGQVILIILYDPTNNEEKEKIDIVLNSFTEY